MTLHEEIKHLIATKHPGRITINRKMYKKLLKELSEMQGSFEGVLIKIEGVGVYSNPELADDFIKVHAVPPLTPL